MKNFGGQWLDLFEGQRDLELADCRDTLQEVRDGRFPHLVALSGDAIDLSPPPTSAPGIVQWRWR